MAEVNIVRNNNVDEEIVVALGLGVDEIVIELGFDTRDGIVGPRGLVGAVGPVGPAGMDGSDGRNGNNGRAGSHGVDGIDGIDGMDSTVAGPVGPDGADSTVAGPAGKQGPSGADGSDGLDGQDGNTGPIGPSGGERGAEGPVGPAGQNGGIGPIGDPGLDGTDGADGEDGVDGRRGPIGETGNDGERGPDGTRGTRGPNGEDGADGQDGQRGDNGDRGTDGDDGMDSTVAGPIGPAGADSTVAGPIGPVGPEGPAGADSTVAGPIGPIGPIGPDGMDSTVAGPIGPIGPIGPDGMDSTVAGPAGADGLDGATGATGPVGESLRTMSVDNTITEMFPNSFSGSPISLNVPKDVSNRPTSSYRQSLLGGYYTDGRQFQTVEITFKSLPVHHNPFTNMNDPTRYDWFAIIDGVNRSNGWLYYSGDQFLPAHDEDRIITTPGKVIDFIEGISNNDLSTDSEGNNILTLPKIEVKPNFGTRTSLPLGYHYPAYTDSNVIVFTPLTAEYDAALLILIEDSALASIADPDRIVIINSVTTTDTTITVNLKGTLTLAASDSTRSPKLFHYSEANVTRQSIDFIDGTVTTDDAGLNTLDLSDLGSVEILNNKKLISSITGYSSTTLISEGQYKIAFGNEPTRDAAALILRIGVAISGFNDQIYSLILSTFSDEHTSLDITIEPYSRTSISGGLSYQNIFPLDNIIGAPDDSLTTTDGITTLDLSSIGDGADGAVGPIGPIGPSGGERGAEGPAGPIGPAGQDGAVGPIGPIGPSGGERGAEGPAGPIGPAGQDGSGTTYDDGPLAQRVSTNETGRRDNKADIETLLTNKAEKINTYTQTAVNNLLDSKADLKLSNLVSTLTDEEKAALKVKLGIVEGGSGSLMVRVKGIGGTNITDLLTGLIDVTDGGDDTVDFIFDTIENAEAALVLVSADNSGFYSENGAILGSVTSNSSDYWDPAKTSNGIIFAIYYGFQDAGRTQNGPIFLDTWETTKFFTGDPADIFTDSLVEVDYIGTYLSSDITTDSDGKKTLNIKETT